jgi:ABC-type branched-subunit amino acid transport system ATPase component
MKTLMKSVRPIRLRLQNITKTFPGVVANDRITLDLRPGEIHALLGENGAGKTTLMRILYGLYQPDDGEILMRGQPVRIRSPRQAIALGMGLEPNTACTWSRVPRFGSSRRENNSALKFSKHFSVVATC